ncbi:MAG: GAF domain-containing protein [Chloroflexi bacterium]|nr:GAF domain-containing protein [Chloroflexota bacterium]
MSSTSPAPTETDPRLLEALAHLNQISAAINRIVTGEDTNVQAALRLIVESAIQVVPGALAVLYAYDPFTGAFDPASRVSAGDRAAPLDGDEPRADGMGTRAIKQRRRVLSYEERDLELHPIIQAHTGAQVAACFPLIVADQALGALYVFLDDARPFTPLELLMLDIFVNQAAMALHQTRRLARVERDLARIEDEASRLRRAGLLISSRLKLEETLDAILEMALEVTNAHYGIFRLVDKRGQKLITRAVAHQYLIKPLVEALPIDEHSVMGWVALHRQPALIPDLRVAPWSHIYYPLDADLAMLSEIAVPLIDASGRLEGVLNLESPVENAFSEQHSHLLQALATQAVIAIQEVRLLDALQEVARLLLAQPYRQVLRRLVELACDLLNGAASAIWTLEGPQLILQVATDETLHDEKIPLRGSLIGQAILRRGPVTSDDMRVDARVSRPDLIQAQGWKHALIVPMLIGDAREPVGAFSVFSAGADPGRFTESEWDTKVLTCLAHYAALAVYNAARQEQLREAQERHAIAETFAAVGDVAANLLHHLNNKVGAIPARVQGIQDKCQPALGADPYLANNLVEIERSATEAMASVRESLSHLHPIQLVPVNVSECVRAAIAAAHLPAGVRVQAQDLDHLPAVIAAQRTLTMVFANLLDNASDALRGQGIVTVRGTALDNAVVIMVVDDGPGIPPDLHTRIFELNYTGRAGTRPGRLGFGLWWVKTLMTRLGGSVAVESDGHHGTTFRLTLPIAKEPYWTRRLL